MKKYEIIWVSIFLILVIGYLAYKPKAGPDLSPSVPTTIESVEILPATFTMSIQGDFSDPTLYNKPGGESGSAFILSAGGDELKGEVPYYFAEGDGYLVMCEIKDKKWIANTDTPKECRSLAKVPTTRTELIRQIKSGELQPIQCAQGQLCYELK